MTSQTGSLSTLADRQRAKQLPSIPQAGRSLLLTGTALVAGAVTATGFAPTGWWVATVAGVAVLSLTTRASSNGWFAGGVGFAFGLGLGAATLNWMRLVQPWAAVGLIVAMAGWYVGVSLLAFTARRVCAWPVLNAAVWLAMEFAAARVPFGGFGWLRLGFAMIDSPLAGLLPVVGLSGVSLAVALTAQVLAWLAEHPSRARAGTLIAWVVIVLAGSLAGAGIPALPAQDSISVGWVQGGAPGGDVLHPGPARAITANQAAQTANLADEVEAGSQPTPDLVVWPESSTDLDPDADAPTKELIDGALRRLARPILVGSVLQGPQAGQRRTVAQWWTPGGDTPRPTYVKRSIVPFGEWIPYRDILLPLFPVLRYVGPQSVAGTTPGLLTVALGGRPVVLGVLICFDVAYDSVAYDLAPAQLLIVQSNNAMYQGSAQLEQQFAITRARAAELRREVLVVTTSGISGLIDAYGKPTFRQAGPGGASGVVTIPERIGATPATTLAGLLDRTVSISALVWLGALALGRLRSRMGRLDSSANTVN